VVSLAEDSPFLSDKAPACTPVRDEDHGPLTALARAALENDPDKVRRFLDGIAPPCGGPAAASWDSAIPTSRTLSRIPHRHRSGAAPVPLEADVSHYAAKIALRVAIARTQEGPRSGGNLCASSISAVSLDLHRWIPPASSLMSSAPG